MKIVVVAPSPVPFTRGGAERALWGIQAAINDLTHHEAEMVKVPVRESTLPEVIASYQLFAGLDLSHFDRIVATKYPAWMVDHPDKTILMMHVLRGVYDTYWAHGQPMEPEPRSDHVVAMLHLMANWPERASLPEFFDRFRNTISAIGPDHPDLVFPGPFARLAIRWLDGIAMAPTAVRRYLAQSKTVANREGYFPRGVRPRIVNLPGHLPPGPANDDAGRYLFTASRLDRPKRIDVLIDAMAVVPGPTELRIAGTGPQEDDLRAQARHDPRIRFLGFTRNDLLPELYANAIAVPFVPADEDLGLVTLEAFSQGTAVVTCRDSGGPTEFVEDGVTGLVADPDPVSVGGALARLVADPALARRLGAAGRRRGDELTWTYVVNALLDDSDRNQGLVRRFPVVARPRDARRRRVLVLAPFAVDDPRHGGPLRCRNLYGALTADADVDILALADNGEVPRREHLAPGLDQVVVPRTARHAASGAALTALAGTPMTDLVAGSHITETPEYLRELAGALEVSDAVILAEPYLLPALEAVGSDVALVYDAYNVEADLKATVYDDTELGRTLLRAAIEVERRAVTVARHVTTCSAADAATLAARYERAPEAFTVIPNGTVIGDRVRTPVERRALSRRWRDRYWRSGGRGTMPSHLAVFFGSWHPPNIEAAELIVQVAAELPHVYFLSVGLHGQAFGSRRVPTNVYFPGIVNDAARIQLLDAADVALNPMCSGSGTNLKLVEYLAAGAPVVSTAFGTRGLDVVDGEHLVLADAKPVAFAAAVAANLADPEAAAERAAAGRELVVARYGWDALGVRLAQVVSDLVTDPVRQ
ncbi:MAG: glycosyltransferase [Acidimicrobiales bacterium]